MTTRKRSRSPRPGMFPARRRAAGRTAAGRLTVLGLLLGLLLGLGLLAAARPAAALEQEGGVRFQLASPTGAFGDQVDDPGLGLALHWGVRPRRSLTVGLGLQAAMYGRETTRQDLPLVDDFELTTTNNLAGGFVFAQWRPLPGAVQPYAEGRLGLEYLWTESKLEDDDWWDHDDIARETNLDDWATSWSAGGGLLVRLSGGDPEAGKPGVLLDFKATYRHGSTAEYLTEGAISIEDDAPVFAVSESATHAMAYEVGVVLTF